MEGDRGGRQERSRFKFQRYERSGARRVGRNFEFRLPLTFLLAAPLDIDKVRGPKSSDVLTVRLVSLDFTLAVGEQSEVLVVEEAPPLLETGSAAIKEQILNRQVLNLPVKDQEFLELALLGAGVVNPPGGTRGDSLQQTGRLINILGQRTGHNLFLVDGVSITDEYFNNVVLNPRPTLSGSSISRKPTTTPSLAENRVASSTSSPNPAQISSTEASTNSSATIYSTRGTSSLRPISPTPFRENQFGAALGRPDREGQDIFFLNYDGQRIRDSEAQLFSVPTAAQRAGIFTGQS